VSFAFPPFDDPSILAVRPWMIQLVRAIIAADAQGLRFRITSWYRDPDRNERVGGSPASQHLVGLAFDLAPADERLADSLRSAGMIVVNEGDHLHVQVWTAGTLRLLVARGFPIPTGIA